MREGLSRVADHPNEVSLLSDTFTLTRLRPGGAGESDLRTSFGIPLIVGMPLPQHRLAPFVAEPFHFTWRSTGFEGDCQTNGESRASSMRHPICKVLEWQERLNADKGLTKVQIGENEGLSKARITQMFSLLRLPEEAQQYLASLTSPALIKSFAIRRLMSVAKLPPARQVEAFEGMKAGAERRAG